MANHGLAGDYLNGLDDKVEALREQLTKAGSWEETLRLQGRIKATRECRDDFKAFLTRYIADDDDD